MAIENKGVTRLKVGTLKLEIHPTRKAAGEAAAQAVAQAIRQFGMPVSARRVSICEAAAAKMTATSFPEEPN